MQVLQIEVRHNLAFVEGQKLLRPASVSPTQWLEFWEDAMLDHDKLYDDAYQAGFEEGIKKYEGADL